LNNKTKRSKEGFLSGSFHHESKKNVQTKSFFAELQNKIEQFNESRVFKHTDIVDIKNSVNNSVTQIYDTNKIISLINKLSQLENVIAKAKIKVQKWQEMKEEINKKELKKSFSQFSLATYESNENIENYISIPIHDNSSTANECNDFFIDNEFIF